VNPEDRPSAAQLLKAPTLQPHIRSYLLRAKTSSRLKSEEKLNLIGVECSFSDAKVVTDKAPRNSSKEYLRNNALLSHVQSHPSTESISSHTQTDSAYASETEFLGELYPLPYRQKVNKPIVTADNIYEQNGRQHTTTLVEKYDIKVQEIKTQNDIKKLTQDEVISKRSSYIEAIASTDQSFSTGIFNDTYDVSKSLISFNKLSAKKRADNVTRRRDNELSSGKKDTDVKLRRKSCEVDSTSRSNRKKILPRRLSVDSIDEKRNNVNSEDEDVKVKQKHKSSLSTLRKFIRRNSKSSDPVEPCSNTTTNPTTHLHNSTTLISPVKSCDSKYTKKTNKAMPNFIERNKKLLESSRSKTEKKQIAYKGRSKSASVEEVSESRLLKTKETAENNKVSLQKKINETPSKTFVIPSRTATSNKKKIKTTSKHSIKPNKQDYSHLHAPFLRKRSSTFDTKETFFKFGCKGENQSSAHVTELHCINTCTKSEVCSSLVSSSLQGKEYVCQVSCKINSLDGTSTIGTY